MKIAFLTCCLGLLGCSPCLKADLLLKPNDRLALCTDQSSSIYIEDYLLMCQNGTGLDFARFTLGTEDPAGFIAGMKANILPYKPTVVLTALDSGSADPATFARGQADAIEALKKAGVRTIVMGSAPCVDSVNYQNDPVKAAAQNKLLGALAAIDKDVAAKEGVAYADVYGDTMAVMLKAKAINGESYAVTGDAFSLTVASAYLKALGCDGNIGTFTVDYVAGTAGVTPGQKIVSFQDHTLNIESTRIPFWYPGHNIGPTDNPWPDLKYVPFDQELNRYTLIVKNLPTAVTKVYWGDANHDFSSAELARGINIADVVPGFGNPFGSEFSGVDNGCRGLSELERIAADAAAQSKPDPQAEAKREAALQVAKSRIVPVDFKIAIQPLAVPDSQPAGRIPVILDTDIDTDLDDVGAVALINSFMDQGECDLLACVHNTANVQLSSCATIQAINAYYGHPSIPIGQSYGDAGPARHMISVLEPAPPEGHHGVPGPFNSRYTLRIHQRFDPGFPNDDQLPPGVDVYRKALASAADGTVVICSIGLMENLQDLIQSQPDSVSNLSGLDLVRKKVRELVIMSGANTMPQDGYLLNKWPTKILWTNLGGQAGTSLLGTPENNPVRAAYDAFGDLRTGHSAWDLVAVWLAVRGTGDLWDVIAGRPQSAIDVTHSPAGPYPNECEVTIKMPYGEASKVIDDELARPPKY